VGMDCIVRDFLWWTFRETNHQICRSQSMISSVNKFLFSLMQTSRVRFYHQKICRILNWIVNNLFLEIDWEKQTTVWSSGDVWCPIKSNYTSNVWLSRDNWESLCKISSDDFHSACFNCICWIRVLFLSILWANEPSRFSVTILDCL
jgi:hypothetical protein